MFYPIAVEVGDKTTAFGVVVPDIEGCFSAGDTCEDAITNAKEAIRLHLDVLAEQGVTPPKASKLDDLVKAPDYEGWLWTVVEVDIEPFLT